MNCLLKKESYTALMIGTIDAPDSKSLLLHIESSFLKRILLAFSGSVMTAWAHSKKKSAARLEI